VVFVLMDRMSRARLPMRWLRRGAARQRAAA
jgi:hypothetical protein